MVTWNNLDTLKSYDKLKELKGHVDINNDIYQAVYVLNDEEPDAVLQC